MSEQKLCCCRRVQLNPRHRRVGARRAANGDAGNARLRQRLELRVVLRRLNQDRRVKADGIQWICPRRHQNQRMLFFQRHHRGR